ncbi:MAG: cyclase family protein [bacterium]
MSKLIDITLTLSDKTPVWPGDKRFKRTVLRTMTSGDDCTLSCLEMSSHNGTHIDAPLHFVDGGATVDRLDPEIFVGPVRVIEHDTEKHIEPSDLDRMALDGVERVIFKTRNSRLWNDSAFHEDYIGITAPAARVLVDLGLRLVGSDHLSVGPFGDEQEETHRILLGNGVVILEGLDLRNVEPGDYELIALPLKIAGGEGSPTRAVLRCI